MRKTSLTIAVFLVLLLNTVADAQEARRDGFWWNRLPHPVRQAYISGISEGIAMGRDLVCSHIREKNRTELGLVSIVERKFAEMHERNFGQATVEQIVGGLNKFYFNPKNRPVPLTDAILTVIKGLAPPPDTAAK